MSEGPEGAEHATREQIQLLRSFAAETTTPAQLRAAIDAVIGGYWHEMKGNCEEFGGEDCWAGTCKCQSIFK